MSHPREERLHASVWAFHAAVQRRDGIEARIRSGQPDIDLRDRSLTAAEAVVEARNALYRTLIAEGWTPPPSIAAEMAFDEGLLRQRSTEVLAAP